MQGSVVQFRSGRSLWGVLAFLAGFAVVLVVVSHYYLEPALRAAQGASPKEKKELAAVSRLMLALVLFVLVVGLMLTIRIGRFFFPRKGEPRTRTVYPDAWSEAGRRMEVPPEDEEQ